MIVIVFVAVAIAVAVGSWYFQMQARQARARAVFALAQRVGFTFSAGDPDHMADLPFGIFKLGRDRRATALISGTHNNMPLRIFDYEYVTGEGRSREVHRNTCATLVIPAACPSLQLTHENALTRFADHFEHTDVKLEYDDFNRRFRVGCGDQKFAFCVLDAQMMEWLLQNDNFDRLEIVGPWVLLAHTRLDPAVWLNLGTWLDTFHTHIPEVVYSTYPRK